MSDKNDLEVAEKLGGIREWKGNVDKRLDEHHTRIAEVEKCQVAISNARKIMIPFMTLGAFVASVLLFIVFSLRDPVTAKAILSTLIDVLK